MWENVKSRRNTVILSIALDDFASIEVEKRMRNNGMIEYEINFHIEDIHDSSIDCYRLNDVEKILISAKEMIEDLFDEYDTMTQQEIDSWIEKFEDGINDF